MVYSLSEIIKFLLLLKFKLIFIMGDFNVAIRTRLTFPLNYLKTN